MVEEVIVKNLDNIGKKTCGAIARSMDVEREEIGEAARLISQMEPKIVIPMSMVDDASKSAAAIKAFCKEQGLATPPPAQQKLAITISALPEETTTVIIEARVEGLGGAETASSGTLGLG